MEDPLQLLHTAWRRLGGSPKSWLQRPQLWEAQMPKGLLGLVRQELVGVARLEAEQV